MEMMCAWWGMLLLGRMACWWRSLQVGVKLGRALKVMEVKVLVTQLCPTLCNPMDYSPPGSSVHVILQTRILEWVAISFPGGSSNS